MHATHPSTAAARPADDPADEPLAPAELYARALTERLHSPARLRERAAPLRRAAVQATAADRHAWSARADLLEAYALIFEGRTDEAGALSLGALGQCLVEGDVAGAADVRDLMARLAISGRRLDDARALLQRNLALPEAARSDVAWCATYYRQAILCEHAGSFDDALRWHYRNVAMAARTGQPAEHALALAGAGGLQMSLYNTDDARSLLAAAWEITAPHLQDWCSVFPVVAVNHLSALRMAGEMAAARTIAALVQPQLHRFAPGTRRSAMLLMATVHAQAGDAAQSEALLQAGLEGHPEGCAEPVPWVVARAVLALQHGQAGEALRLCEAHFEAARGGRLAIADTPMDRLLLHSLRARAYEALGDGAAVLEAERAVLAVERELLRGATRAQRLTLQVRYELETAERARDEALRRAEAAQGERERLAALNQALADASEAKTRWMAAASHDLRQPLHAMRLQLALMKPLLADPRALQAHAHIEGAHDALRAMFDALLNLSRIDAGVVVPNRQAVPLRPLCARLAEEMAPVAEARGLRLALHLPMNLRPHLAGTAVADSDPALLETLLRNLLDNALKYTRRGGVVLALRPPRAEDGAARTGRHSAWRLQVRDTGPGIDAAEQERAFAEFVRLEDRAEGGHKANEAGGAGRPEGLGLGLSIVQRLARLLGHGVALRSRPGCGCLFEVTVAAPAATPGPAQSRQIFEAL